MKTVPDSPITENTEDSKREVIKNIYAYTSNGVYLPAFISINREMNGCISVCVRTEIHQTLGIIFLSPQQFNELVETCKKETGSWPPDVSVTAPLAKPHHCIWEPSKYRDRAADTSYITGCEVLEVYKLGPFERGFKFCPYCGGELLVAPTGELKAAP